MVDDGSHSSFKLLLLAATLAASLSLSLVQPAQAREEADFLPPEVSLISAKPSQGTCDTRRESASGRESVGCDFGVVQSGGMAEVEIVVTPEVAGTITNTAVAAAEFSPTTPANSSSASVRVKPEHQSQGLSWFRHLGRCLRTGRGNPLP